MDWTSVELPGLVRKRGKNFRWFARPRWGKQRGSVVSPRRMWRYFTYVFLRATYIINFIRSAGKSRQERDFVLTLITVAMIGYLIGSFPSGYIAGRIAGIDIRKAGSGNIGATNVTRTLGKAYGYPVLIADFGKSLVAVVCAKHVPQWTGSATAVDVLQIIAGVCCVLGNAFPVWLGFRGGKGVAVSAGVIFGLMPWAALIVMLTLLVTFCL